MSASGGTEQSAMTQLLELMVKLRDPVAGCPWDRVQTFASLAPYTLEEAYEVVDAIQAGEAPARLRDELGDLLFQVVFQAQLARERGWFDFADVARAIHDKLVRRHPHVFGGPDAVPVAWEELKARERAAAAAVAAAGKDSSGAAGGATGVLAGVPRALPALMRAQKLGRRAGRVGFDWTDMRDVRAKISEELAELDEATLEARDHTGEAPSAHLVEEMGDLLFAIANWGRHVGADAEQALRAANAKFERRFASMESLAHERSLDLTALSLEQWEDLWREAKCAERAAPTAA